jgi:tRNA pseudouridine55 synthase
MTQSVDHNPEEVEEGEILLIDKPMDWTSFDVVNRVRHMLHVRKTGHAGTLDPRATGLLILCTGRQTKRIEDFANLDKVYTGTFELGIRTPSFDLETEVTERMDSTGITRAALDAAVGAFIGRQLQTPPMYSAVKHKGKPLYKFARKGKTLHREPKEIEVREFVVVKFDPPVVEFRIACTKGTYVRSLVSDVGDKLGCGGTLTSLRRTRIGEFKIEDAMTLEALGRMELERGNLWSVGDGHRIPA